MFFVKCKTEGFGQFGNRGNRNFHCEIINRINSYGYGVLTDHTDRFSFILFLNQNVKFPFSRIDI